MLQNKNGYTLTKKGREQLAFAPWKQAEIAWPTPRIYDTLNLGNKKSRNQPAFFVRWFHRFNQQ
jgi:hypothetical protein